MSKQTDDLVLRWVNTKQHIERLKKDLSKAQCDFSNARNALGKFLIPSNMKPKETIGVWVNGKCMGINADVMVQVTMLDAGNFEVKWREK